MPFITSTYTVVFVINANIIFEAAAQFQSNLLLWFDQQGKMSYTTISPRDITFQFYFLVFVIIFIFKFTHSVLLDFLNSRNSYIVKIVLCYCIPF